MKSNPEYATFNSAMDTILRANPQIVKAAMKAEKRKRAAKRAFVSRASTAKGQKAVCNTLPVTSA